jgi:hypothetical protein
MIGSPHDLSIVFDNEHGIADVAEPQKYLSQPLRVPRMESYRRFVENIQRSDSDEPSDVAS